MSAKLTVREVLAAFFDLERAGKRLANDLSDYNKLQLHDAAVRYAHVVRRVARAGRTDR